MTTNPTPIRSAIVAWLKAERRPTPADSEPEAKPQARPESPEEIRLAGLGAASIAGGLLVAGLVGSVVGWLMVGFGGLCLIAYLVVGAVTRR